jgi:predicted ATPase
VLDSVESHTFGALLRQHRLAAGLTQAALAELAGVADRTIQQLATALGLLPAARAELEAVSSAPRRRRGVTRRWDSDASAGGAGCVGDRSLAVVPAMSRDAGPTNLPVPPTALLGRERELAEISALLRSGARLVTLTGPGGVGKTRLAMEVAATRLDRSGSSEPGPGAAKGPAFADGVFLVELAPLSDPALVASSIAQVLGILDLGRRTVVEGLQEHLRHRRVQLLLDNFEHVLAASPLVTDLLARCPGLAVLVTSREALRLRGEQEHDVAPLALPSRHDRTTPSELAQNPAVALFVERGAAIRSGFTVTEENGGAVAEICTRLGGLPLAIELAAARVRTLTPEAMVERLERRLPMLTGGARDLPARQQTLRAAIDWSHDLLDDADRRLFRRLAVFVGGWTLEAAEAVCNAGDLDIDVLNCLESLTSTSLIRQSSDPDGQPRLGLLETIREYGLERLGDSGEAARIRRRHAEYFQGLAERAKPEFLGAEQGLWLNRVEAEHDNLRAALRWTVQEEDAKLSLQLAGALAHFWEVRGHQAEGRAHLTRVLGMTRTREYPASRASVLENLGYLAYDQGEHAVARACHEESLAIARGLGHRRGVVRATTGLARIAFQVGDFSTSRDWQEQSLAIARDLGDRHSAALALHALGSIASALGNHAEARAYSEECLAVCRAWATGGTLLDRLLS